MAGKGKPSAADELIAILARTYYPAQTKAGEAVCVRYDTPSVMIRMGGTGGLRQRLAAQFYAETGRAAPGSALADAIAVAEGMALGKKPIAPALRVAEHAGRLYLDLGRPDGQAVEIGPGAWRVVSRPPVLFARTALSGELPVPVPGTGDLDPVRHLFNIRGDAQWALFVACRVASLIPGITHPIELVSGPAGSAKTATTRLMADWADPAPAMIPVPRDGRTWAAIAGARYCLPVDNVSWVPTWWSDLLCKAASGDGWVDRALYSDGGIYVAAFQSVVILNGISMGAVRGDLADRSVRHALERPVGGYLNDDDVVRAWHGTWAWTLAWLLDRCAEVLADMACYPQQMSVSRLARFAQVVECVDRRWNTMAGAAWADGRREVFEDVADSDPVATAITKAIGGVWEGTATALLDVLELRGGLDRDGRQPWTPRTLAERVERSRDAMATLGWRLERYRGPHNGARLWRITPPGVLESPSP